jgi:hypothetical protein
LHLDSLIWQIAKRDCDHIISYFKALGEENTGAELSAMMPKGRASVSIFKDAADYADQNPQLIHRSNQNGDRNIMCFIPCCKCKTPSGNIITPPCSLSPIDLPGTYHFLQKGREKIDSCVDHGSLLTSALNLYAGSFYQPLLLKMDRICSLIKSCKMQLYIISGGYGLVHAFEPIHEYEAQMSGQYARHWSNMHLADIIKDLLLTRRPGAVYGFFTGNQYWSAMGSAYRYFFTEGLSSALRQGLEFQGGCFYRIEGQGPGPILEAFGHLFGQIVESGFGPDMISSIEQHNWLHGQVRLGFDRIS